MLNDLQVHWDKNRRNKILELALEKNVELHFANEFISLKKKSDLEKIQKYLNFAVRKKINLVGNTKKSSQAYKQSYHLLS